MDTPKLLAFAAAQNRTERFEKAIKTLEDGLASKHIWNVDYEDSKNALSRIIETAVDDSAKPYNDHMRAAGGTGYRHGKDWGESDKDARWLTIYNPNFMNVPGAVKKLEKYEATEDATFSIFLNVLREVAQVVELIKSVKPFIEKGRKPSENPKEVDVTNTGECPVCFKRQKLTFDGTMVAHGYTIPRGWGGRNGMCMGHGYKAWELAPDGAIAYKSSMEVFLADLKKLEDDLLNSKSPSLSEKVRVRKNFGQYEDELRTYERGSAPYEKIRTSNLYSTQSSIHYITKDIETITGLIANWKAQPLKYGGVETQERWKSRLLNKNKGISLEVKK